MAVPTLFAGRYRLVRKLGAGNQGDVYEAVDQMEGSTVALKLLQPSATPSLQWFEAFVLRGLTDHHILPIHNADEHMGQAYLATALARHGSIDARIASAGVGLDVDTAVAWTRQACMGIGRGHAAGLVHNDIKPANLFVNDKDECIVGDWGYAGALDPSTGLAFCRGASAETIGPEVAAVWGTTTSAASVASDIYSLGATAFWMLAGHAPVDLTRTRDTAAAMAEAAIQIRPRLRDAAPHVPKRVCDGIDRAMAFNPGDRFDKSIDFAAALGGRLKVQRRWVRTDEHSGHVGCWRGEPVGNGTALRVCAEDAGGRAVTVSTTYQPSGRTLSAGCARSTRTKWVTVVRQIIAAQS